MNLKLKNQQQIKNQESFQKKVVRSKLLQCPIYCYEICLQYEIETASETQKNCKNSF